LLDDGYKAPRMSYKMQSRKEGLGGNISKRGPRSNFVVPGIPIAVYNI
jgi:hypothetical protein